MALADNDLFNSRDFLGSIRLVVEKNKVATFATNAGATVLLPGLPVAKNSSSKLWVPYTQPSDAAVFTVTNQSTDVDGGSQDFFIDGLTLPLVAWNVTPAALEAAINGMLADAGKGYTVSAACSEANLGVAAAVMTVTFAEAAGAPTLAYDGLLIADGGVSEPHVFAVSDAGTALNETNVIRGFIAHDSVTLDTAGEVQGVIALVGEVHRDDINTTAMLALLEGSPSEAELDIALRAVEQSSLAFLVRGLADVA